MRRLCIGLSALRGKIQPYARRFDLLELRAEPGLLPRRVRLRAWAESVPDGFVFSVRLPTSVARLEPGQDREQGLRYALGSAQALGASWLVLQTPASVTPGGRSRRRLEALLAELRAAGQWRVAWDPHGPWDREQAARYAAEQGLVLVCDAAREAPAGEVAYARLLSMGLGRLNLEAAERAAEQLAGCSEAFVVFDGHVGVHLAQSLRSACELAAPEFIDPELPELGEDEAPDPADMPATSYEALAEANEP